MSYGHLSWDVLVMYVDSLRNTTSLTFIYIVIFGNNFELRNCKIKDIQYTAFTDYFPTVIWDTCHTCGQGDVIIIENTLPFLPFYR